MTSIDDLERRAREATQGEWEADGADVVTPLGMWIAECGSGNGETDAAFIAAASPSTILALVARLRAAEEETTRLRSLPVLSCDVCQHSADVHGMPVDTCDHRGGDGLVIVDANGAHLSTNPPGCPLRGAR